MTPFRRAIAATVACSLVALVSAAILWAAPAPAATAREVLDQARRLGDTERKWTDRRQSLTLTVVDRRGGKRTRELDVLQKKFEDDRSKSILFFRAPPEIKGTGFLQWIDPHAENRQWLYLPELKRVRQISGSGKRESFMGTDFSYEDLAISSEILDWTESDAEATIERQEECGAGKCWVILFTPKGKEIAYAGIRAWLDDAYLLRRFEFLSDKGEVLKRLEVLDIRDVGNVPSAFRYEMENVRGGSRTLVEYGEIVYDTGIADSMFSERRLEKGP